MFTKLSANIEQVVGFIILTEFAAAHSKNVTMVTVLWRRVAPKIDTSCLQSVRRRSTTDGRIWFSNA